MNKEDILQSCKDQLKFHIEQLLEMNVRVADIEIELLHYMKKLLYVERS
jgi:hypothetical protein